MVRPLTIAVLAVVVLVVLAWLLQRRLVYLPGGEPPAVETVLPGAEAVSLTTSDGLELEAWYLSAGPPLVVVFPGNAGNRADRAPLASALAERGMSVLLVDYRGYGGNPGRPTEAGLRRDAEAALAWARSRPDPGPLVLFGESLGSGPATWAATIAAPDALVLRSPLPSLGEVARRHYGPVPDAFLRDRFAVAEAVSAIDAPTLVVVGDRDAIVPAELSRRVHDAAAGPARWVVVTGAGHNDAALVHGRVLVDAIADLVASLPGRSGA